MNDKQRLDWLEQMANRKGGLLLHDGSESGRTGLGLKNRSLREAIDDACDARPVPVEGNAVARGERQAKRECADAFTLSRRMCEALQFVAMDRDRQGALPNIPQLSTMHALEERGLIERNPWRLSQAGRLLYPLLAHAGLVEAGAERLTFTDARAYASNE